MLKKSGSREALLSPLILHPSSLLYRTAKTPTEAEDHLSPRRTQRKSRVFSIHDSRITIHGILNRRGAKNAKERQERELGRKSMDTEGLKQRYGNEYPAAITVFGVRMVLEHEGRFSRHYHSKEANAGSTVSKFEDGTASVTLEQLQREWNAWSQRERHEFCMGCPWLAGQADLPDMLRFIMKQPEPEYWSDVALAVADHLPQAEAFATLRDALGRVASHTANLTQGIAATKHPDAKALLTEHLAQLWERPDLWANDPFSNWTAFDATCCIAHLLELGAQPSECENKVRSLSKHVCAGNRQSCGNFLHQYYGWLPKPQIPSSFAP